MILGKVAGKITTTNFHFKVEQETRKFEFVQILHKVYDWVLCQVVEIERTDEDIAKCVVIGYKDDKGRVKPIRIPFDQGSEVLRAEDNFIKDIISLGESEKAALIGKLDGKNIDVYLDLKKLLTKHVIVLAKSGSGKSYTTGVLVEEIIDKNVPIIIIDPHGEYTTLKEPNTDEKESLAKYNLKPKGFKNINEYGDISLNASLRPIKLNNNLTAVEIAQLIPGKLSNTQTGLLYSAIKHLESINFSSVLFALETEENNAKWTLINNLEYLKNLDIFTDSYAPYNEIVQTGKCSIFNLKGISPDVQEIIVYKLLKDLFELRKQEKIPPFFCVVEEAHNFCVTGDTVIFTEKGNMRIDEISNEKILTYNHLKSNIEYNTINKYWPSRKAQVLELISASNRKLKCTPDHPIFEKNTYVKAESANYFSIPICRNYDMNKKRIEARLLGAIFSDGWMSINKQVGFSGKYEDMETIIKELKLLGIRCSNIHSFENKHYSKIEKKDGTFLNVFGKGCSIHCSTIAFKYFQNLGAAVGEKVIQEVRIPKWIMQGSNEVKSEFLAGLMGGDGDIIRPYGKNFYAIRLYFSKVDELKASALEHAHDIMKLFADLDVKTTLNTRLGNIRKKDKKRTTKYIISINNDDSNSINFFEKIGYRYNQEKEILCFKALTYFKIKQSNIQERIELRNKAISIKEERGWGKVKIAKELNLDSSLVAKWIYKPYNNKDAGLIKGKFPNFIDWMQQNCDDKFIYEKIVKKRFIEEQDVYNITTDNSNFIANNILIHNCPERSFGEARSSKILRTISSEGRKFGLGLCLITQRPARIDKSVISQCTTQIILKVTNPSDLKAITSSVEGINAESETEIMNLPIGTAMITGIADMPLFVNIRPRMTKHGGHAIDILEQSEDKFFEKIEDFEKKELLPIIKPKITQKEIKLMSDREIKEINTLLIPGYMFICSERGNPEFNLLIEMEKGEIVVDVDTFLTKALPDLDKMPQEEIKLLHAAFKLKKFLAEDLMKVFGLQAKEMIDDLVNKGYLIKTPEKLILSDKYVLSQLSKCVCFEKIQFLDIEYLRKEESKVSIDKIKEKISKFCTIKDLRECNIVKYTPVYK
ncbi:MAG: DUF87 domain-containing protein [archaeon]